MLVQAIWFSVKETCGVKSFLRIFPYILVFVIVVAMQVKLDADNRVLPYLDPYGRESKISETSANRPPQVLGDNRYAWLSGQELIIAKVDPSGQKTDVEKRPVPSQDIYTTTTFRLSGLDLYWVGEKRVLKHAAWENGKWSDAKSFDADVIAMDLVNVGDQRYLLIGTETGLKVYQASGAALTEVRSFPMQRVVFAKASVDQKGIAHIGVTEQLGMESYNLLYLTLDPGTKTVSDPKLVKNLSIGTSNLIDESVFGIDETHGYYLMTYKSSRKAATDLRAVSFPLDAPNPKAAKEMKLIPNTLMGEAAINTNSAYVRPVQEKSLQYVFVADYMKNPRNSGKEVFFSTLQGGEWKEELTRVTNLNSLGGNPVFDKQGDTTTVLFTVFAKVNVYDVMFNSNDPAYALATNKIVQEDYERAAMEVPKYLGMSVMILVLAFAWPLLSFAYLFYFVMRKEEALYDHPNRHLFVAIGLYLISQIAVFLIWGNLDAFFYYAPAWLQSGFMIALLFVFLAAISYLFTRLYVRTAYERSAMGEFSYFLGINLWTVILVLSYYLAG
jgi:hypothetical protein